MCRALQRVYGPLGGGAHARSFFLHAPQRHAILRRPPTLRTKCKTEPIGLAGDAGGVCDECLDIGLADRAAAIGFEPLVCTPLVIGMEAGQHSHLVTVLIFHKADSTGHQGALGVRFWRTSSAGFGHYVCRSLESEDVGALLEDGRRYPLSWVRRKHFVKLLIVEIFEVERLSPHRHEAGCGVARARLRLALHYALMVAHGTLQVAALNPRTICEFKASICITVRRHGVAPPPTLVGKPPSLPFDAFKLSRARLALSRPARGLRAALPAIRIATGENRRFIVVERMTLPMDVERYARHCSDATVVIRQKQCTPA